MSATYEGMSPGGHETYATSIFSKIKTYLDSNPYGYLTTHQDISGKADKSATVSTITWSNNKLTKTINGTTSDVVSAATILGNLTSSQVTTALGYVPGPSYIFESSDGSINILDSMVPGIETIDLTLNGLYSGAYKVDKAGDIIYGDLDFAGSNVCLKTSGSSTDDSGDIVFYYGNGNEKCRIYTSNEFTAAAGPSYRVYKKDGTALYSGRLATMADLSWGNISGKPSYLPTAGGTMTGIVYSSYGSSTWVNSLTKSAITLTDNIGFGGWICGPTKNGRITIATYKDGDDVLYIGYGERGRTTNSYTRKAYWNGANGLFASTVVLGESMLRSSYIGRNDSSDSGYVNHVNTGNTAYAPVRASAFTNMSCKYTKTNIVDISEEDALKLLDIRPVNFDYIEEVGGQKNQIGVLAEDTYEVLPKVVSVPDDYVEEDFDISKGIHQPLPSVDYAKFVPYLIKLVQMQQKEIDNLKKERT